MNAAVLGFVLIALLIGALIGGVCQSATEPSAIMLSARPILRAQQAALEDVRLEAADKFPHLAAARRAA